MQYTSRLTVRCSQVDRQLLDQIAARLRRTPSNTLRYLIHEKAGELQLEFPEQNEKEAELATEENIREQTTSYY